MLAPVVVTASYCGYGLASRAKIGRNDQTKYPPVDHACVCAGPDPHGREFGRRSSCERAAESCQGGGEFAGVDSAEADDDSRHARTSVEVLAQTGRRDAAGRRGGTDLVLVAVSTQQGGDVQASMGQDRGKPWAQRPGQRRPEYLVALAVNAARPAHMPVESSIVE